MIIQCSKCGKKYDLDRSQLVKGAIKVRCPSCKHIWVVKSEAISLAKKSSKEEKAGIPGKPKPARAPVYTKLIPTEDLIVLRAIVGFLEKNRNLDGGIRISLAQPDLNFLPSTFPVLSFQLAAIL